MDPALIADPYGGLHRMREETPVVLGQSVYGAPTWYVTRYDDVRAVLGNPRFVNNPDSVPGAEAVNSRHGMLEMLDIPAEFYPYISESVLDPTVPSTSGCGGWYRAHSRRGGSTPSAQESRRSPQRCSTASVTPPT